ncbi:hypothetical protein GTW25_02725 [Aliihoeflea aestuarii]|uniref:hypothetical protein n=1 Tax=Aliihoeflea aestuarii TaxID=453840 RepID=UPI002093282F|nr:hypothetical protein [Aliihoeflea aestuarii]MCO6389942.1 hypothetical protein [Aliihoeflea aestuarii]
MSLHHIDNASTHVEACDTAREAISAAIQAVKGAAKSGTRVNAELGQAWADMLTNFHLGDLPKAAHEQSIAADGALTLIAVHHGEDARERA